MTSTKIALVTGANKGIGKETARQLAQQGVHVYLGSRDAARGEAAANELRAEGLTVDAITLDANDPATHAAAAHTIAQKHGRLDILINNAGINLDQHSRASEIDLGQWRSTFETNFFGVIAVTQAFLPLLRKSDGGRIVNLSSILASNQLHATPGSPIYDFKWPAYDASKTALNAFTVHLAYELRDTKIKVNAAHPGWVKTEMGGDEAPMELVDGAKTSVELALIGPDGPSGAYVHMGQPLPW